MAMSLRMVVVFWERILCFNLIVWKIIILVSDRIGSVVFQTHTYHDSTSILTSPCVFLTRKWCSLALGVRIVIVVSSVLMTSCMYVYPWIIACTYECSVGVSELLSYSGSRTQSVWLWRFTPVSGPNDPVLPNSVACVHSTQTSSEHTVQSAQSFL